MILFLSVPEIVSCPCSPSVDSKYFGLESKIKKIDSSAYFSTAPKSFGKDKIF